MNTADRGTIVFVLCGFLLAPLSSPLRAQTAAVCSSKAAVQIKVDQGHPWRPPFGIGRVGALPLVHVELSASQLPRGDYAVVTYRNGQAVQRQPLNLQQNPAAGSVPDAPSPFFATVQLTSIPTEVALQVRCAPDREIEPVLRQPVDWPAFEADASARPDRQINPVDLGTILVPHDWLLLADGQSAVVDVAAIARTRALPHARLRAWFEGSKPVETAIALEPDRRLIKEIRVPLTARGAATRLHVALVDGDRELWSKQIHTMIVAQPPRWPVFGAVATKLRYDAPIAVGHPKTGQSIAPLDYDTAWDPKLNDVVVALPNGSRFVFWRGANYIPIWAGLYNTGFTYEWTEAIYLQAANAEGGMEMPEPLNDKTLRYGSVRIVESTASRVHVRWTYQATDIDYRIWGDQVAEDYYFYPDGFGTRVVNIVSPPNAVYETSEFILLTPQAAFPFEALPRKAVEVLYLDGEKRAIDYPIAQSGADGPQIVSAVPEQRNTPALYRIFQEKRDTAPAIWFNPTTPAPVMAFGAFYDQGEQVTPAYWGDHWPLSRGKLTRYYIHDGIYSGPAHNSLLSWAANNPAPLSIAEFPMPNTLGQVRTLQERRWAWLIAKSEASDEALRAWAQSFSSPPALQAQGARLDAPSYSPERRAIRLVAESRSIEINLKPAAHTVNPVFELDQASRELASVTLDGRPLAAADYAWDGATLWVKANIDSRGAAIRLNFH